MSRYIDADALIKAFETGRKYSTDIKEIAWLVGAMAVVDSAPTADVEPVRHVHWIKVMQHLCIPDSMPIKTGNFYYKCSECGWVEEKEEPYCNCGAKMDGKEH